MSLFLQTDAKRGQNVTSWYMCLSGLARLKRSIWSVWNIVQKWAPYSQKFTDRSFIPVWVFSLCFFNQVPQPGTLKLSHIREGEYIFQLTVTDTAGQRSSDNVSVTVLPMVHSAVGEKMPGAVACVTSRVWYSEQESECRQKSSSPFPVFYFALIHYVMTSLSALNCCFKVRKQASIACLLE